MEILPCSKCQQPNHFPYLFEKSLCITCIYTLSEQAGGAEVDRLLHTVPEDLVAECERVATAQARRRSHLFEDTQLTVSQNDEETSSDEAVAQRCAQWHTYIKDWKDAFGVADPRLAYAELVFLARELQTVFRTYLHQSEAPRNWRELCCVAPRAFNEWVISTQAFRACVATLVSPGAQEKDDMARMINAVNAMFSHMVDTRQRLCGAWMNLRLQNAGLLLTGAIVSRISMKANPRLFNTIVRYRKRLRRQRDQEPWANYGAQKLLRVRVLEFTKPVWDSGSWQSMNELRTAVVKALVEDLVKQNTMDEREVLSTDPEAYEALCDHRDFTDHEAQMMVSPEEAAVLEEARQQFRPAMRKRGLAPREIEMLWWRVVEDLTQEQTATRMGVTLGTVSKWEARIREKQENSSPPTLRKKPRRSGRGG